MNDMVEQQEYYPGSAMAALTPPEAAFVEAMIAGGAGPSCVEKAAAAAGYSPGSGYGWKLMRKSKILAALREEAAKGLLGGALLGQKVLFEIATDQTHKDRFRAARELLAHSGFTITQEQKITVEHVNSEAREMIKEIGDFARATGLDARQLLAAIGVQTPTAADVPANVGKPIAEQNQVVDAEFEEVWTA